MDIQAAKKRCEAATEGRWRGSNDFGHHLDVKATMLVADFGNSFLALGRVIHRENLDFIAHARTDLPAALAKIQEMDCLSDGTGRVTEDVECQRDSDPACLHHFAFRVAKERDEAQGKLDAVQHAVLINDLPALDRILFKEESE
jgi:hypothetical protein